VTGRAGTNRSDAPSAGRDRGSGSLWLLAVGLLLVSAGTFGAAVGAARVARHQARVAADFGALAGAARTAEGAETACVRAAEFARANGAQVARCGVDGLEVQITVELSVTPLPGMVRADTVTARAGPVRG